MQQSIVLSVELYFIYLFLTMLQLSIKVDQKVLPLLCLVKH